jgi:tRNA G46 methylase TrmB
MKQWNQIFKKQGRIFLEPHEDAPKMAKIFKKYKVKSLLDLGCGTGRQVVYFAIQESWISISGRHYCFWAQLRNLGIK